MPVLRGNSRLEGERDSVDGRLGGQLNDFGLGAISVTVESPKERDQARSFHYRHWCKKIFIAVFLRPRSVNLRFPSDPLSMRQLVLNHEPSPSLSQTLTRAALQRRVGMGLFRTSGLGDDRMERAPACRRRETRTRKSAFSFRFCPTLI